MFRRATADDRDLLDELTLAGVRHWGHHRTSPAVYAGFAEHIGAADGPENHPVFVLEEDGEVVAFYELRDRGDHVELLRMFMRQDLIGQGYGRMLWNHAVDQAAQDARPNVDHVRPGSNWFLRCDGGDSRTQPGGCSVLLPRGVLVRPRNGVRQGPLPHSIQRPARCDRVDPTCPHRFPMSQAYHSRSRWRHDAVAPLGSRSCGHQPPISGLRSARTGGVGCATRSRDRCRGLRDRRRGLLVARGGLARMAGRVPGAGRDRP